MFFSTNDLAEYENFDFEKVHCVKSGNVLECKASTLVGVQCIKKLSKEEYLNTMTGEVKEFQHHEKRVDDKNSLLRSFAKLREMVNANVVSPSDTLFVTLTYRRDLLDENGIPTAMNDSRKAYRDFNNYSHSLNRYFLKQGIAKPAVISVIEPQKSGAWHFHVLYFWKKGERRFIANETLAKLWGQGFVKIEKTKGVDNLGAYLSAYLCDLKQDDSHMAEKRARLQFYPAGLKVWRCSRNCLRPVETWEASRSLKKALGAATLRAVDICSMVIPNEQNGRVGETAIDILGNERTAIVVRYEYNLKATKKYSVKRRIRDNAIIQIARLLSEKGLQMPESLIPRYRAELRRRNEEKTKTSEGVFPSPVVESKEISEAFSALDKRIEGGWCPWDDKEENQHADSSRVGSCQVAKSLA